MKSKLILSIILGILLLSVFTAAIIASKDNEKIDVIIKYKKDTSLKSKGLSALSVTPEVNRGRSLQSVTNQEYRELLESDLVEYVQINHKLIPLLQDSVPKINANDTWDLQINNTNLSGSNYSVCVIDSGINYTHPDLGGCTQNSTGNIITLVEPVESLHHYANSTTVTYTINYTGFTNMAVHFVNISVEYGFDNLTILDGDMNVVVKYDGDAEISPQANYTDVWSPSVAGDTIYVRVEADQFVSSYGFYIDKIINGSANVWENCDKFAAGWDFANRDSDPFDDHGHGTHVSGIAAGNGNIKGVAPDAKIVSIKVIGDDGTARTDDILDAIDWCIDQKDRYNISVISMSLGTDCDDNPSTCYTNYCDASEPGYADVIDNAVSNGIPVIIASGNDANYTHIDTPSCIQNAMPVGSSTKADGISGFSNRNSLVQLFAPGSDINSTNLTITGGELYAEKSGTSMATPHVAGAVLLIKQFLDLTSQTKTPQQIETAFYDNGFKINDSGNSNINYSRINVLSTIYALDNTDPVLTLVSPDDDVLLSEGNKTFNCNASDLKLVNLSFYLWNGALLNSSTKDVLGSTENSTEINITNMTLGTYTWGCEACDNASNCISENNTLNIGDLSVTLESPSNNIYVQASQDFNCSTQTSIGNNLTNLTLVIWADDDTLFYNTTTNITGENNYSVFSYDINTDDTYTWNCLVYNDEPTSRFADSNKTIIYDDTNPDVDLEAPEDGDDTYDEDEDIDFEYSVTDASGILNCSLVIDDDVKETDTSVSTGTTQTITYAISNDGTYDWRIDCYDLAGNKDSSSEIEIDIQAVTTGTSGSSSTDDGWITADDLEEDEEVDSTTDDTTSDDNTQQGTRAVPTETQRIFRPNKTALTKGLDAELKIGDSIELVLEAEVDTENGTVKENQTHTITLKEIKNDSVTLTIRSEPIDVNLTIGKKIDVELTGDGVYDISIKLNNITDGKVDITVQKIKSFSIGLTLKRIGRSIKNWFVKYKTWIIVVVLIVVLFVINDIAEYYILKKKGKGRLKVTRLSELKKAWKK